MTRTEIAKIFSEELARFQATFPRLKPVRLQLRKRHFDPTATADRDVGWYDQGTHTVYLMERVLGRSAGHVRGIIRHELGHAADDRLAAKGAEKRADRLALQACGVPIRYTKEGLQHATHGKAERPRCLHA